MNKILQLAVHYSLRSMSRHRQRTILTICTVAFSVGVMVTADRYLAGMLKIWQEASADYGTGHAQLHSLGFEQSKDGLQADKLIVESAAMMKQLQADPEVESFSRRVRFDGLVSHGRKAIFFLGIGVEPKQELVVAPKVFAKKSDVGRFLSEDDPFGAVIGRGMADTLDLAVGDSASISIQPIKGGPDATSIKIRGIVELPLPKLSKRIIFMNLASVQRLMKTDQNFSEVVIRLKDPQLAEKWVGQNRGEYAKIGAHLEGWWQIDPYIKKAEVVIGAVLWIVALLLFICAGISVLNIIYMVVAERTIEIGTLMALGAKPFFVRLVFATEALLIGLFGGGVGLLVSHGVVAAIGHFGVNFKSPFGSGFVTVYAENDIATSLTFSGLAVLFCVLAALPPAAKAARVEPTTAFRGQLT